MTGWPVELPGVTESVVTTLGPNDQWNAAALGLHGPVEDGRDSRASSGATTDATGSDAAPIGDADDEFDRSVTARTWGNTRTRRNFEREGSGHVQFVDDPVVFVESALGVLEVDEPVLDAAAAWVAVRVERVDAGEQRGTEWVDWALHPREAGVERRSVPTVRRGFGAVIEATVAASRLGVAGYDEQALRARLAHAQRVVERCGDRRERAAFDRVNRLVDWTPPEG